MSSGALVVLFAATPASASDHRDGPAVIAAPAADITDVYAWIEGGKLVMVLNVHPDPGPADVFSDALQYALHVESAPVFGFVGVQTDIICSFDAAQTIQCWVGDQDYVTGDASQALGLTSASGAVRVFAGKRADPAFFNLEGFQDAVAAFIAGVFASDGAGCPTLSPAVAATLIAMLQSTAMGSQPAVNAYAGANVLSLVLEVDVALLDGGGPILSVWASTHEEG